MNIQVPVEREWNRVLVLKVTVDFVVNNELPWALKQSEMKKRHRKENAPYRWVVVLYTSSLSVFSLLQLVSAADNIRLQWSLRALPLSSDASAWNRDLWSWV